MEATRQLLRDPHATWRTKVLVAEHVCTFSALIIALFLAYKHYPVELMARFWNMWGYDNAFMAILSVATIACALAGIAVVFGNALIVGLSIFVLPILIATVKDMGWISFALLVYLACAVYLNDLVSVFGRFEVRRKPKPPEDWYFILLMPVIAAMPLVYYRGLEYQWVLAFFVCHTVYFVLSGIESMGIKREPKSPTVDYESPTWKTRRDNRSANASRNTAAADVPEDRSVAPQAAAGEDRKEFMDRFPPKRASLTFGDVIGMDAFKERLLAAGREVMADLPSQVAATSKKKGRFARKVVEQQTAEAAAGKSRNGIMLFGEPGNGKTMMAEALAGELDMPIIVVTYGELASRYVNQTTEVLAAAFDAALAAAPCVLFIDEVDSLLRSRDTMNANFEHTQTVNTLLTRMVNLRGKGVLLMAATNYIDSLDAAAIREGRFDFKIEVPPPDEKARIAIIEKRIQSAFAEYDPAAVTRAAKRWKGFSAARIKTVTDEAVRIAASERKPVDFLALTNALRVTQGRTGYKFTEDDPVLDDLVFTPEMKETLYGIADRMVHIEEIEEIGGTVPSGLLFTGEPGGGKTISAKALAKTAQWAFLTVSGQDLMADTSKVDKTIAMASELRPCVIMIDEAEDVLGDRAFSGNSTITNKLLAAIDGAAGKTPDVLWVAATNHPDKIDAAAKRGGRFTEKVHFPAPDHAAVAMFVDKWRAKTKAPLATDFVTAEVATALADLSYANVKEVLQTAVNIMVGRRAASTGGELAVTLDDLRRARERVA